MFPSVIGMISNQNLVLKLTVLSVRINLQTKGAFVMTISWIQAILLAIFLSLSSIPGMGGSSIGNYTLGRPLIGGLISGLILGDVTTGIMVGVALQVVYIAW